MPIPYAKTVVEIPTIIEFSKDHPLRSKYGSNMNNNVEGKTNHNMLSAKSATCAVSLVSSYSQVNDNTLTKGIEVNNAPKTADFFATSLTITTTAPLKKPLDIKLNHSIVNELMGTNSSFPLNISKINYPLFIFTNLARI